MPPPGSPTGLGMLVKNSTLRACSPWLRTKNRMNASGTSAISTEPAQKATNSHDTNLRHRL
jgi:hypothetical protein